jgi:Enoyl-(Acyl carrier protein) reductase
MRDQGYGRILQTSSNAAFGIGANATYAATKAGLIGLTFDAAAEGRGHGIHVNAMMPVAYSRMIEQIPDPAFVDWFRRNFPASRVAAAAAFLLSRDCAVTGRVLDVGGGRVARIAFAQGGGWYDAGLTAEKLRDHLGEALDVASARVLDGQPESMLPYSERFPFAREGAPTLALETVVGAGRPRS